MLPVKIKKCAFAACVKATLTLTGRVALTEPRGQGLYRRALTMPDGRFRPRRSPGLRLFESFERKTNVGNARPPAPGPSARAGRQIDLAPGVDFRGAGDRHDPHPRSAGGRGRHQYGARRHGAGSCRRQRSGTSGRSKAADRAVFASRRARSISAIPAPARV